jgi:hypothetical protein
MLLLGKKSIASATKRTMMLSIGLIARSSVSLSSEDTHNLKPL